MLNIRKVIMVLTILIISFIPTFELPIVVYAENLQSDFDENELEFDVFKVVSDIVVDKSLIIKEGTIIYGLKSVDSGTVKIQFKDKYFDVNILTLEEIQIDDTINYPEYTHYSDGNIGLKKFLEKDILNGVEDNVSEIEFIQDIDYPIDIQSNFIIVGNVKFNAPLDEETIENIDEISNEYESSLELEHLREYEEFDNNVEKRVMEENEEITEDKNTSYINQSISTFSNQLNWDGVKYFKALEDLPVYDNRSGKLVEVGKIKKGEIYPRYESSPKWHMIQFSDFKAFVTKEGTVPTTGDSPKNVNKKYAITTKKVTAKQNVTVYDNSGGVLKPFGMINKGQEYLISHDYFGQWIYVVFADRVGFINSSEIERENYFPEFKNYFIAEEDIPVYDNRSGRLLQVGELKKGQVYPRYEGSKQWHQIQFDDFRAFVHKKHTAPDNGKSVKNRNVSYKNQAKKIVAQKDILVYDNSSGKLIPYGKIKAGQEYSIAYDYGGKWIYIIFADRVGYIDSSEINKPLTPSDKYLMALEDIPIYDNSSGRLVEVGTILKGNVVPRTDASPKWSKIKFGYSEVFVEKKNTVADNGSSIKNELKGKGKFADRYTNKVQGIFFTLKDVEVLDSNNKPFAVIKQGESFPYTYDYGGKLIYVVFAGRGGFVKKEDVELNKRETHYNITLEEALKIQMKAEPQTDKSVYAWVSKTYIDSNHRVTASALNVRTQPTTAKSDDNKILGTLPKGTKVEIIYELGNWYAIKYSTSGYNWIHAIEEDVLYYLNPNNFIDHEKYKFQFLDLSKPSGAPASVLNNYLSNKGVLKGKGQAFINAALLQGINDIYLLSHALLETGNGSSTLANGVEVGINSEGKPVLVTSENRNSLKNIKKYYNVYGIGAYDSCPTSCGAIKAYEEGWDSVDKAIVGGAAFIGNSYIKAGLNTLYKMRWNPEAMVSTGRYGRQYATDIGWAIKQTTTMYNLYKEIGFDSPLLDIPVYK